MKFKKCTKCNKELSIYYFHKNKTGKDGYRPDCKECRNLIHYSVQKKNFIIKKYGLSYDEIIDIMFYQKYQCKICKNKLSLERRGFSVDHNHITGKIRGLLCGNCNAGIALLKHNPVILKSAIIYLSDNS